jgi:lipooligosaccharide transport system permease protein
MTAVTTIVAPPQRRTAPEPGSASAVATLAWRRLMLSVRTPRELLVPVMAPLLFAIVIAPALADTFGATPNGIDYMTFVAVSVLGLLIPLSCVQSGLGVIVDRLGGARRDLLAAPIRRPLIVAGNLVVAVGLCALQVVVVIVASALRGADYQVTAAGLGWFAGATLCFAVGMYGVAEVLANRFHTQEEYIGALPAVAVVPYFFAGGLFPISALPVGLTLVAKVLPITHALALMRYGLVDHRGQGLHDIWGLGSTTVMACLSLAVLAVFALAMGALAVRVFTRDSIG